MEYHIMSIAEAALVATETLLSSLDGEVHEFVIHIYGKQDRGFITLAARVNVVEGSPAIWIGPLCIEGLDIVVESHPTRGGSYVIRI
jgi:hypothetical protein